MISQIICLLPTSKEEIKCECFDGKPCNIHIDDSGSLVCRYGSNEGVINGIARVVCPLEIASEREKWKAFLQEEINGN